MTKEIAVLAPDDPGVAALAAIGGITIVTYEGAVVPSEASDAEVLIAADGDDDAVIALAQRMPRLRMVQTMSAGVERWLPHLPPHVLLSNARGAHGGVTAELAVAALLSLVRDLPTFLQAQTHHRWEPHQAGTLLRSRVLVLGAGDVATEVRKRLEPFGATVVLVGRRARDGVAAASSLSDLLPLQDAVVVTLPLDDDTRGLVDKDFLAQMRDGSILVNVGRGAIVDTSALTNELRTGRLRAALDVSDPEPLPEADPLWDAPGLLLTPHVGGSAPGRADRAWRVAAEQVAQFISGREPDNTVVRRNVRQ